MIFFSDENAARAQAEMAARVRLYETADIWEAVAAQRNLRFERLDSGLPSFEVNVEGTRVGVSGVGSVEVGFHTRVFAEGTSPLRGKVKVGPPGDWDALVGHVKHRDFFADRALDDALVVRSSSQSLAHTVLDERAAKTLRVLAPARVELTFEDGAITVVWAGVERDFAILDDAVDMASCLANRASETSAYR